jgi:hypothetical protein
MTGVFCCGFEGSVGIEMGVDGRKATEDVVAILFNDGVELSAEVPGVIGCTWASFEPGVSPLVSVERVSVGVAVFSTEMLCADTILRTTTYLCSVARRSELYPRLTQWWFTMNNYRVPLACSSNSFISIN